MDCWYCGWDHHHDWVEVRRVGGRYMKEAGVWISVGQVKKKAVSVGGSLNKLGLQISLWWWWCVSAWLLAL